MYPSISVTILIILKVNTLNGEQKRNYFLVIYNLIILLMNLNRIGLCASQISKYFARINYEFENLRETWDEKFTNNIHDLLLGTVLTLPSLILLLLHSWFKQTYRDDLRLNITLLYWSISEGCETLTYVSILDRWSLIDCNRLVQMPLGDYIYFKEFENICMQHLAPRLGWIYKIWC